MLLSLLLMWFNGVRRAVEFIIIWLPSMPRSVCQYYLFTVTAMLFVLFCANTLGDGANKYQQQCSQPPGSINCHLLTKRDTQQIYIKKTFLLRRWNLVTCKLRSLKIRGNPGCHKTHQAQCFVIDWLPFILFSFSSTQMNCTNWV